MDLQLKKYGELIRDYAKSQYKLCLREPDGQLRHKFIVPGSCYSNMLWDWDSWLTNIALRKIAGNDEIAEYERGCILNFLELTDSNGKMPIFAEADTTAFEEYPGQKNIHKPCIAQHALFVAEVGGDVTWLADKYSAIERFLGYYEKNFKHESGLYFWGDDFAIGVDNDPTTFYRPDGSSASIFLNSLMYRELLAAAKLGDLLGYTEKSKHYESLAKELKRAIKKECWDERDGTFYSVDINLLPVDPDAKLHSGAPRHWTTLIQRFDVWSSFMPLWAGIASAEEAERMVKEHYLNERTFLAPYGVRSLSRLEKMYKIEKSGNPSCWLGPIWGISNYMVWDGLVKYGYTKEATELAEKTLCMFGRDIEENGEMHEYYDPETGVGVNNPGFQNWNLLSLNMLEWLEEL